MSFVVISLNWCQWSMWLVDVMYQVWLKSSLHCVWGCTLKWKYNWRCIHIENGEWVKCWVFEVFAKDRSSKYLKLSCCQKWFFENAQSHQLTSLSSIRGSKMTCLWENSYICDGCNKVKSRTATFYLNLSSNPAYFDIDRFKIKKNIWQYLLMEWVS